MSPRERDLLLPPIPEDLESKFRSSNWNDEDAEDREEQGLFEQDNAIGVGVVNNEHEEFDGGSLVNVAVDDALDCAYAADEEEGNNVSNGNGIGESGPFYIQSSAGDSWELTWPIWHMLPRNERRAIATQHGMKSIGEFEEYMSLSRAVDDSENYSMNNLQHAGEVKDLEMRRESSDMKGWHTPLIFKPGVDNEAEDDDDDDDESSVYLGEDISPSSKEADASTLNTAEIDLDDPSELIRLGGLPCSLPDEILHKAFSFLAIDDHAALALVSPYWSRFTRCESLYKSLCQRIYLNQSKRKTLHVNHFGNSYRKMLEMRPRVRTGGGLYVLKYQEVRKIQRDMWTEIPVGAILESVYYRYLYFFEDGRVMYALTHATPMEMIPRFSKMLLHGYGAKDKWGVWGRYQIKKDVVKVQVSHSWHDVCFQLKIIPSNSVLYYDWGDKGMYTTMVLEEHLSSASGNFEHDSYDLVKYEVPAHSYFRFLRDRRL